MRKINLLLIVLFVTTFCLSAQNAKYYQKVIKELSSSKYDGRAYYNHGMDKAADYISNQFKKMNIKPLSYSYYQYLSYDVNVFHGDAEMSVDGVKMEPGKDFVMREFSPGIKGHYRLYYIDTVNYDLDKILKDINKPENQDLLIVCDFMYVHSHRDLFQGIVKSSAAGLVKKWDSDLRFYKAYSDFLYPKPIVWVSKDFPNDAKEMDITVENEFFKDYPVKNVIAKIEGSKTPDSAYVLIAHYDGLGHFGKNAYFPGANDNISGVAMLLTLAEYYSKPENAPAYSLIFLIVAGEETGLRGSQHFVDNPTFPLSNIKYAVNFDMIADNADSINVQVSDNATIGYNKMLKINDKIDNPLYLKLTDLSEDSDHFPFAQKGVPTLFFMSVGDAYKVYHTQNDNIKNCYFESYDKLFKLMTGFVE